MAFAITGSFPFRMRAGVFSHFFLVILGVSHFVHV